MNTPPPKNTNGGKPKRIASCPHSDDCAAPHMHSEVMASLDNLSGAVGLLLESHERVMARVDQVHSEALEHRRIAVECNDELVLALRRVEKKLEATDA